jgi:hypothetical protein
MASTYSALKFELITTGEQSGTWGATTNVNLGTAIEEAIVGIATANFTSDANLTLTLTNTNATQVARNFVLNVTSGVSLSTTRDLIVPAIEKPYIVQNNTSGSQSIRVIVAGQSVTVPNGKSAFVYNDGTDVKSAIDYIPALTTPSATITGGTIAGITQLDVAGTSAAGANLKLYEDTDNGTNYVSLKAADNIASNVTFTLPSADGTSGQVLQTDGSGTLSFTTASGISTGKSIAMAMIFGF